MSRRELLTRRACGDKVSRLEDSCHGQRMIPLAFLWQNPLLTINVIPIEMVSIKVGMSKIRSLVFWLCLTWPSILVSKIMLFQSRLDAEEGIVA